MTQTYNNYVGGEWTAATTGETFESRNPARTDGVLGSYQRSSAADAARAIETAANATTSWADTPAPERGRILERTSRLLAEQRETLASLLAREEGKMLDEATGEVQRAVDIFQYYAAKARDLGGSVKASSSPNRNLYTVKEPLGVVALITP